MTLNEYQGDLFDFETQDNVVFAHCIASDFGMFGGIAKQFVDKYDMKAKLQELYPAGMPNTNPVNFLPAMPTRPVLLGKAIKVGNTYNLITKLRTSDIPLNYARLSDALWDLKNQIEKNKETHLVIPKLGCGIDRMEWDIVSRIIEDKFKYTDVTITVAYL